jgi:hypothetical protein
MAHASNVPRQNSNYHHIPSASRAMVFIAPLEANVLQANAKAVTAAARKGTPKDALIATITVTAASAPRRASASVGMEKEATTVSAIA